MVITFNGKFTDSKDNEYDAAIGCTEALLVDWWHSSEKYPEGGDDVKCEYKSITLYFSGESSSDSEPDEPEVLKGDVDCNGAINSKDLVKLIQAMVGKTELNDAEKENADMDSDGRLSIIDIIRLKNTLI